ncbi:MAG: hypothetical protein ACOYX1_10880 [Acidobacteriota bacterium]
MRTTRPPKGYYNETEAARALGVTLDDFRALVRDHLLEDDEQLANLSRMYFQASDLVVLRMLAAQQFRGACTVTP